MDRMQRACGCSCVSPINLRLCVLSAPLPVQRIEDPIGLLPPKLILGINKRGVHFFRPVRSWVHATCSCCCLWLHHTLLF